MNEWQSSLPPATCPDPPPHPGSPVEGDHRCAQLVLHHHGQAHLEVGCEPRWEHSAIGGEAAPVDAELLAVALATAPQ